MTRALVTGAKGFIGRHLAAALRRAGVEIKEFGRGDPRRALDDALEQADVVYHLAGVNRPADPAEFEAINAGLTQHIAERLEARAHSPVVVLASSAQAALDNPYGRSKRAAEEALASLGARHAIPIRIYRLPGVFGRWSRPRYNSVVATFCHAAARGEPLPVTDRQAPLRLVHVDDVVQAFLGHLEDRAPGVGWPEAGPEFHTTVGDLADRVSEIAAERRTLEVPELSDPFIFRLYATYLTYLPEDSFAYDLQRRSDARGSLAEFVRSRSAGQIFVSRTRPGVARGNHWHLLKAEKFFVLEGDAVIRFRQVEDGRVLEYPVSGTDFRVVDIPPGYTHSIENVGAGELVVLFWASEIFDAQRPDTYPLPVLDA